MYKVVARVVDMKGKCPYHKKGDFIEVEDDLMALPSGRKACIWSLSALMPVFSSVQREHAEPDDWLSSVDYIQCPDSSVEVLWEIEKKKL